MAAAAATTTTTEHKDVSKLKFNEDESSQRVQSTFREFVEEGGRFAPEKDRYHLYVSLACPYAHRVIIARELKGLQDIIPVTRVDPRLGENGWPFSSPDNAFPDSDADPLFSARHARDIYLRADPKFNNRFTVPFLWDKKLGTIVNNESAELLRIFNSGFNSLLFEEYKAVDLYPEGLRAEIDEINAWVNDTVNSGVYKAGTAQTQDTYETACLALFASFNRLEAILADGRDYLVGSHLTEADIRLYTTLVRFDPVYHVLFKCNLRTIRHGYSALHLYMRKLYWRNKAFGDTTNFEHIKMFSYGSLVIVNPNHIIPIGPDKDILPL